MSLGDRIIKLRTGRNLSQYQLSQAMEVSRQAVSKWESGLSTPDPAKLIRLAQILDTDLEYLTTGRVAVPSRPPVVLETVRTVEVEKVVEKPVVQVVEKVVECKVEVPVEVPVVEYVDRPVVKRVVRTRYLRNPLEFAVIGTGCFLMGLLVGILL